MSEPERELRQVDALVQAYLGRQAEQVDGETGWQRVRAGLRQAPATAAPRRRSVRRLALAASVAALAALAFFGGWYLGPVQAGPRELVEEVKRVHNQPLARCYLVETQRMGDDDDAAAAPGRQVRVWTSGERFWVEVRQGDSKSPFVWGLDAGNLLWAVLDAQRGVRVPLDQAPRPLQRIADVYTLNGDRLLGDVLRECVLSEEPDAASRLTRVILAQPQTDAARLWLAKATLEIDNEAKVLRRLTIARNLFGNPLSRVVFTLVDTRADDGARYQLEGHLTAPSRIHEGHLEPKVKLELLGRWLGARNEQRERKETDAAASVLTDIAGRTWPLVQADGKGTLLFFLMPDCPISNAYAPEIQRICADYEPRKIAPFIVHADPDVTAEQAGKHAREYGITCPVLLDRRHVLVKKTGVTMAPEAAVLGADGTVLYRGRIDDWYAALGQRRGAPTERNLRDALAAICRGEPVAVPTTQAIGCPLPEPKD